MSESGDKPPLSALYYLAAAANGHGLTEDSEQKESPPVEIGIALESARQASRRQFGRIEDIGVEFVRNPKRGQDFDARHNRLLITRHAVEILLGGKEDELLHFRQSVEDCGGFLIPYNGKGQERLEHAFDNEKPQEGGWLMAEASAQPVGGHISSAERVIGADAQVYVPPDRKIERLDELAPLPLGSDDRLFEGETITKEIALHPEIAILIADIAAEPEWQKFGFASAAEDGAFKRVIEVINRSRQNAVKYALAAIASVKGVQDKNHIALTEMHDPGFRNIRSFVLHTLRSRSAPGVILGKQVGRTIPVELPGGDDGHLVLDWYLTAQPLSNMVPRQDITIHEENLNDY